MNADRKPVRVLIVDDSAVVRQVLSELLAGDDEISVMGAAADPYLAVGRIAEERPDVIILDIEMPRMDGLTFLEKLMQQHPIPVIICSSLIGDSCDLTMRALDLGAVEVIAKPQIGTRQFFEESKIRICDAVKAAAQARPQKQVKISVMQKHSADVVLKKSDKEVILTTDKVIAIGASTGGTEALRVVLQGLPLDSPATVIVQHMPERFTASFAKRLDELCAVSVKEAENGDSLIRGRVLIAPGNRHLLVKASGARYFVEVRDGPLVSRHRPSVDVLFRSTARYAGKNAIGVIMTGMGDDGAKGLLEMKEAGARTVAQDEMTSVVFGMPFEAIRLGAADLILPLEKIAREVIKLCQR
ncbi:MAG: chemotaxis response regulator protein-glutamate methylesterase [Candidatus Riflebacteria bacterium GWC2_50_8]|nr:MAG: chemotaxis response regulator protein-glutamate methylesterase [Candidatus Riflebacteria bacterium GWC2_50_8]